MIGPAGEKRRSSTAYVHPELCNFLPALATFEHATASFCAAVLPLDESLGSGSIIARPEQTIFSRKPSKVENEYLREACRQLSRSVMTRFISRQIPTEKGASS